MLYLTLLTILFSYAYDCRTTQHDPTPESAWTISVLTPCISALDLSPSSSPEAAFRASYRRALAFPLYRNWELCERVRADVAVILAGGRRAACRVLLEIRSILERHEVYYVYNKIWIDDYCVWIQANARCVRKRPRSSPRLSRAHMINYAAMTCSAVWGIP